MLKNGGQKVKGRLIRIRFRKCKLTGQFLDESSKKSEEFEYEDSWQS